MPTESERKHFEPLKPTQDQYHDVLRFGNGVEVLMYVLNRVRSEVVTTDPTTGATHYQIWLDYFKSVPGLDVAPVHFLPDVSTEERVNSPEKVPQGERILNGLDCIEGFLSLAAALRDGSFQLENHNPSEDFMFFTDTNTAFAAFVRQRCGFRGNVKGTQAWVEASKFASDENYEHMMRFYERLAKEVAEKGIVRPESKA